MISLPQPAAALRTRSPRPSSTRSVSIPGWPSPASSSSRSRPSAPTVTTTSATPARAARPASCASSPPILSRVRRHVRRRARHPAGDPGLGALSSWPNRAWRSSASPAAWARPRPRRPSRRSGAAAARSSRTAPTTTASTACPSPWASCAPSIASPCWRWPPIISARSPGSARIAPPHIAVVTTVEPAHLEAFGSLDAIAREKGDLVAALPARWPGRAQRRRPARAGDGGPDAARVITMVAASITIRVIASRARRPAASDEAVQSRPCDADGFGLRPLA